MDGLDFRAEAAEFTRFNHIILNHLASEFLIVNIVIFTITDDLIAHVR
jgi:hypothetical protein